MNKTEFVNNNYGSSDELLSLAAYVLISSYREKTMKILFEKTAMTPKAIALDTGIRQNHISVVLRELKKKNLAVCINEEARKGRLYKLTGLGMEVYPILLNLKKKNGVSLNDL